MGAGRLYTETPYLRGCICPSAQPHPLGSASTLRVTPSSSNPTTLTAAHWCIHAAIAALTLPSHSVLQDLYIQGHMQACAHTLSNSHIHVGACSHTHLLYTHTSSHSQTHWSPRSQLLLTSLNQRSWERASCFLSEGCVCMCGGGCVCIRR